MPSLLPHHSQALISRPTEGPCLPPWAWSPLPTDSWSPVHLFLLKPTQNISRGSSVSLDMVSVATWHASTRTGCIQAGSPVCVRLGLRLLPSTLPQVGLRPAPRREGVGWVSSWLVCLRSLPAGIHGHPGLSVLGVGWPGTPGDAPSCPASQAVCSGSVPCSAEMTPPSLASPAPRSCPRTSPVAQW